MISIFILCYNEEVLLPHTINHYKTLLPSCNIVIYDNMSTDNSPLIAKTLGCEIIYWESNNEIDDFKYTDIKNNCWKNVPEGWILTIDMDEWLCVSEDDLEKEKKNGTNILQIEGYSMIGTSNNLDLTDINLSEIQAKIYWPTENKSLCFYRNEINEINYNNGAHQCWPELKDGFNIKYSENIYLNKHMDYLGLKFIINKHLKRHERAGTMREHNHATHYLDNIDEITANYNYYLENSIQ